MLFLILLCSTTRFIALDGPPAFSRDGPHVRKNTKSKIFENVPPQ